MKALDMGVRFKYYGKMLRLREIFRNFALSKENNMSASKPRILLIYTGGTIGMIENPSSKALEPFDFNHLLDNVPKIKLLDFAIDNFQFDVPIDSADMNPAHWGQMAKVIEDNYDNYDGFVILHGTDTMAYTASALSFMLNNLTKPVIITGSQLPIGEVRTDGEENLMTALQVAAAKDTDGEPMVREVAILFQDVLLRGNRSTKFSADNFDAFKSSNYPVLANIGLTITYNKDALHRPKKGKEFKVEYLMDTNVTYLDLFPGIQESVVRSILNIPGLKGVVLKTYGVGNSPSNPWLFECIREAVDKGVLIVNISQCSNGKVTPMKYSAGVGLAKAGTISGQDLTSEAAITKMMYLFGIGATSQLAGKYMGKNLHGELTE